MKKVLIGVGIGVVIYLIAIGIIVGFMNFRKSNVKPIYDVAEDERDDYDDSKKKDSDRKNNDKDKSVDVENAFSSILNINYDSEKIEYTPQIPEYQVAPDCSNVFDLNRYYLNDAERKIFAKNNFVVVTGSSSEFFDIYENNRYLQKASFVTTDSMLHTYHLYFAMLQKNTEKNYLIRNIEMLSQGMFEASKEQYEILRDTEWEEAAIRNVAFFAVGCSLTGKTVDVPSYAKEYVSYELQKISSHDGIDTSKITNDFEDYSQYKPRGYYEGDADLERYFQAMMWYGRIHFSQKDETLNRCACLITMAMQGENLENWQEVYDVTSFFAGSSDDNGYGEYLPVIQKAYGNNAGVKDLAGDKEGWKEYDKLTGKLDPPAINSLVFEDDNGKTDKTEEAKGFRFMGQRFTLDAAIFTQLCYSKTAEAADGTKRLLPDALDVPAALGSETAKELLIKAGNDKFPGYTDNLEAVRKQIADSSDDLWTSSLYGGWMNTLNPLLEEKGTGYPAFMNNKEWAKKNIESYLGSWTELKHDTILYSKQMMAEMGGDDDTIYDDRGYVETEPEVFGRLAALTTTTVNGLDKYGVISSEDKENLSKLGQLAKSLQKIAVKELNNESLSQEDYTLIREYGGNLEHFWKQTIKDKVDINSYVESAEFPMALIADVATDPNGRCLEEAIGGASQIYVAFLLDGEIHIGIGGVFTYYQFEQPLSNRLTDSEWRRLIGMELNDDMTYNWDNYVAQPDWTQSYRYTWKAE